MPTTVLLLGTMGDAPWRTEAIATLDRTIRILAGITLLAAGYYFKSWWGLIGVLPITTGLAGFCPAYLPFGLSTCRQPVEKK